MVFELKKYNIRHRWTRMNTDKIRSPIVSLSVSTCVHLWRYIFEFLRPVAFVASTAIVLFMVTPPANAQEQTSEHTLIGLFSPDRVDDLKQAMADVPELNLVKLDYENARITFRYNMHALFPDRDAKNQPKPEEIAQRINNLLRDASDNTFTLKLTPDAPREKLKKIEFQVGILDCKGCRYAAYLAAIHVNGVEQATVSKDNIVTTWIDPSQTDSDTIAEALKKARIEKVTKQ